MSEKEKQLLLKDLCARLPHELWVEYEGKEWLVTGYGHGRVSLLPSVVSSIGGTCPLVEEVRLYLRPMSSMTEEEKKEYNKTRDRIAVQWDDYGNPIGFEFVITFRTIDYLLQHHFDFRDLISKGLALEAPEGMYKQ